MSGQKFNNFQLPYGKKEEATGFKISESGEAVNSKRVEYLLESEKQIRLTREAKLTEKVQKFFEKSEAKIQPAIEIEEETPVRRRSMHGEEVEPASFEENSMQFDPVDSPVAPEEEFALFEDSGPESIIEKKKERKQEEVEEEVLISEEENKENGDNDDEEDEAISILEEEVHESQHGSLHSSSEDSDVLRQTSTRYFGGSCVPQIKCRICRRVGHTRGQCPSSRTLCHYCLDSHQRTDCEFGLTCLNCGSTDHLRSDCLSRGRPCPRCLKSHPSACGFVSLAPRALASDAQSPLDALLCPRCLLPGHLSCAAPATVEIGRLTFGPEFRRRLKDRKVDSKMLQRYLSFIANHRLDPSLKTEDVWTPRAQLDPAPARKIKKRIPAHQIERIAQNRNHHHKHPFSRQDSDLPQRNNHSQNHKRNRQRKKERNRDRELSREHYMEHNREHHSRRNKNWNKGSNPPRRFNR